jgi:uncharacterized protein YbjT (DUF2867 family)
MILITGATGNVGSEVVSLLVASGQPTSVFVRDRRKAAQWSNRAQVAVGDFSDPDSFARAAEGTESIFLIAAGTSSENFCRLLRLARAGRAPRVVFVSGTVADWPDCEIGALFRNWEQIVRACGLPWTILRPCDFMSNTFQWIGAIRNQGAVYNCTSEAKSALIAPGDVAATAVACLTSSDFDGQTIGLTGDELLSVPEQVEILRGILRRPIQCVDISIDTAVESLRHSGASEASARFAREMYEMEARGEAAKLNGNFAKLTGRPPKTFRVWAQDHSERFR